VSPDVITLPAALVISAGHCAAELIRRCHAAGQPVPAGVLATMNALTAAIAVRGNDIGQCTTPHMYWMTAAELSQRSGIPERTIRYRAANGHIPGARKVGQQWAIPSTETP